MSACVSAPSALLLASPRSFVAFRSCPRSPTSSSLLLAVLHQICLRRGGRGGRVPGPAAHFVVGVQHLEVLDGLEGLQQLLELGHHVELVGVAVVPHEGPELLQPVQLAAVVVPDGLLLEVLVQLRAELALQAVAEESEEALEAVPVAGLGVL